MKTCLITGANSGIGKSSAILLAQEGHKVIIGCRNLQRGEMAIDEIKCRCSYANVELRIVDLSSQASIRLLADNLHESIESLDVLIHNAADFDLGRKKPVFSEDNIETVWATNHLGPVFLTYLLLDLLKKSDQARIITIASKGLLSFPFLKVDFDDPEFKNRKFSVTRAYYQSKLAQVMYTYWLSEELKDTRITVNCIRVTNVELDLSRYPNLSKTMIFLYSLKRKFSISPDDMARTYVFLATANELQEVTGKYFNEKNQVVTSSRFSKCPENINKLMILTLKYFHL